MANNLMHTGSKKHCEEQAALFASGDARRSPDHHENNVKSFHTTELVHVQEDRLCS
jgi:hypothetical protein